MNKYINFLSNYRTYLLQAPHPSDSTYVYLAYLKFIDSFTDVNSLAAYYV